MSQHTDAQLPQWAEPVGRQIAGVEYVGRKLVIAGLYIGAFLLLVWFVGGLIIGFVSLEDLLTGLLGAGGIGTAGEFLRRFWGKDK